MTWKHLLLLTVAGLVGTASLASAFNLLGGKWHDPALPATFQINTALNEPTIPGDEEFDELRKGFTNWSDLPGLRLQFLELPEVTSPFPCGLQIDGANTISMLDCTNSCGPPCLGVTSTSLDFGMDYSLVTLDGAYLRNIENDITYTDDNDWITLLDNQSGGCDFPPNEFVLQAVATHEVGHFIGLDHVTGIPGATMAPSIGPCNGQPASPHPDDIAGTEELYLASAQQEYQIVTHDIGSVRMTVNNFGNIGPSGGGGIGGFEFPVGTNHIFEGSLIVGAMADTNISDDYRIQGTVGGTLSQDGDFLPLTDIVISTGIGGGVVDQETVAEFDDSVADLPGAAIAPTPTTDPIGLTITQRTYACANAPDDDYVILQYTLRNDSGAPINDLKVGMILDWDFNGAFNTNSIDYDAANGLGFVSDPSTTNRGGVCVLNSEGVSDYRAVISSGAGLDAYVNTTKRDFMNSGFTNTTETARDIGMVIVTGTFDVPVDGEAVAAFAVLAGTSLADLQANCVAAKAKYQQIIGTTGLVGGEASVLGPTFSMAQNTPNPFNPSTRIAFNMQEDAQVELRVYDLQGRMVRNLVDEARSAGVHEVTWDGRDDSGAALASGVYFYELRADGELVRSRKMQMVR